MSEHSEALLKKSTEVLDVILNTVKAGGEFAVDQLPDVAQQFITYNIWWNGSIAAINLALFIASFIILVKAYRDVNKISEKSDHNPKDTSFLELVASFVIAIVSLIIVFFKIKTLMLFVLAPKVAIIQFFAGFVK